MNNTSKILLIAVIVLLVAVGIYYFVLSPKATLVSTQQSTNNSNVVNTPANQNSNQPSNQNVNQPSPTAQIYENKYMKLSLVDGWNAKAVSGNEAAVNITKGNYILYINVNAGQASGVKGGRFGEIAGGSPSADSVVTEQPSPPCGTTISSPAFLSFIRDDLYVSGADKKDYCAVPTNGKTVWYFSYLTTKDGGYFNYYKDGETPALVVTMSYNSKVVNSFPVKGSGDLSSALSEMTKIAQSLQVK